MARRALITGITGQDGTLLAELLRSRGLEITGIANHPGSARVRSVADVRAIDIEEFIRSFIRSDR